MPADRRCFLFLQGPLSPFFFRLGSALRKAGCLVHRVNFCGGDLCYWPFGNTHAWRGHAYEWPQWIASLMEAEQVTDLVLIGDWRPLHREACWLACARDARVWVYEEGYLRPGFLTLEEGGVNAYSRLPREPEAVWARSRDIEGQALADPSQAPNPMLRRVLMTAWNHVGNFFLFPFFHRYRTHRPYCIGWELTGHIPRYVRRRTLRAHGISVCRELFRQRHPFYLMPLQLDADAQVRRHSPFTGTLEYLAQVVIDFSRNAPRDSWLVVKNHPLDNGLRNYRRYMRSLARATGCSERLRFVEGVDAGPLCRRAEALVLCNSTLGLTALRMGKPVYCLGDSVYAMKGLAVTRRDMPLSQFWTDHPAPDPELLEALIRVMRHDALVPGNFYSPEGIQEAIAASLARMGVEAQ